MPGGSDGFTIMALILEAALTETVPGEKYLSRTHFQTLAGPEINEASLREMLDGLVDEGILEEKENQYCVTKDFSATSR
jgi:hypothetical protein